MGNPVTEKTDTVIVGAGPAGLSVAACLKRKGLPFILLEKSGRIGSSWHNHYERLHLHTDKKRSELPFLSYPASYPKYPSRLQFIEYLQTYAGHFNLEPRFNSEVVSARHEENRWITRTTHKTYISEQLVIASGYNCRPVNPGWPGSATFPRQIIHSSEFRNGSEFKGKKVLVVGFGNSGGEIAIDLVEHGADVSLSVRSPVNIIPRDLLGLPILAIAIPLCKIPPKLADLLTAPVQRLLFGDLSRLGLKKLKEGPFEQIYKTQRIPLIDVGTVDMIREGEIDVCPGISHVEKNRIHFTGGTSTEYDAVVMATGFRPALESYLDKSDISDPKAAESFGLYFCGFYVAPTGMLREIAIEARKIARTINRKTDKQINRRTDKAE